MSRFPENHVVVWRGEPFAYPREEPFAPSRKYPEYEVSGISSEPNAVYEGIRQCFHLAGLDGDHFGTREWNPLQNLIQPGETVLLKPNMVHQRHPRDPDGWRYTITHGSVIRAVADYVWKAIGPSGKIIVGDAPQTDASFSAMVRLLGLDSIRDLYLARGLNFEVVDLRQEEWDTRGDVVVKRRTLPSHQYGSVAFDLGQASEFVDHGGAGHYYGADYDSRALNRHHSNGRHEYLISGCAINCDVVFSVPKLKTHKKAGITASLKNLVGLNADKNWLPHHTEGDPQNGGDEHPNPDLKHRAERKVASAVRGLSYRVPVIGPWVHRMARGVGKPVFGNTDSTIRSGNWFGNDTVWRMCLDLNKIVFYGNADGSLREPGPENRKRHYVLVDGILAGQGNGPLDPDPVRAGMVLFGVHPPSVDAACAYLMGFDPGRIPIVGRAFQCRRFFLSAFHWHDVLLRSNCASWDCKLTDIPPGKTFHFEPHFGWKGHIELGWEKRIQESQAIEALRP
jgi:uncharacterized protein (DUF362 family)